MKLYGTTTSPFVRRVRVAAAEIGEPIDRIDTATEAGMAALREVSPIHKVPVAVVESAPIFDSRAIIAWLVTCARLGRARARSRDHVGSSLENLVNAVDAALDAVIQLFYLRRDGVAIDDSLPRTRQRQLA